jgi:hypothetical protein
MYKPVIHVIMIKIKSARKPANGQLVDKQVTWKRKMSSMDTTTGGSNHIGEYYHKYIRNAIQLLLIKAITILENTAIKHDPILYKTWVVITILCKKYYLRTPIIGVHPWRHHRRLASWPSRLHRLPARRPANIGFVPIARPAPRHQKTSPAPSEKYTNIKYGKPRLFLELKHKKSITIKEVI